MTRPVGALVGDAVFGGHAHRRAISPAVLAAGTTLLPLGLIALVVVAALGGAPPTGDLPASDGVSAVAGVSAYARRDIPTAYLQLYLEAAQRYGLDWAVLAAIGKVECDHGRDPDPSCTREGAVNQAGAGGPMQFLASTWALYGVTPDGAGSPDRWNPTDAIYGAANYLRASGAPRDYRAALYAYNQALWYVREVESIAARYRAPAGSPDGHGASASPGGEGEPTEGADEALQGHTTTAVHYVTGERAVLAPGDGHIALIPLGVPVVVQAILIAGNELQGLPYGPGGHPDPRGAAEEDCSSSVNYVLYRAGVRPIDEIVRENPLAQDYVGWGDPGPGRWVTIYATDLPTPHVFILVAGLRLDTAGPDEGPNRNEGGPRWRILDHIPTWARWSVRHPPGL